MYWLDSPWMDGFEQSKPQKMFACGIPLEVQALLWEAAAAPELIGPIQGLCCKA